MRGEILRPWRLAVFVFLLVASALGLAAGDHIRAQAEAVVVLGTALDTPVVEQGVALLTREPTLSETTVAGAPTTFGRPAGDGPWPALVIVNGATPKGRHEPALQRLVRGLARAGYLVALPDLPGLPEGRIDERTVAAAVDVARAVADRPDARGGRVGLVGVSVGTSLALLAALEPELTGRVRVVTGTAPFADLANVVRLATTGYYRRGNLLIRYETDPFVAEVVARSLAVDLPELEALLANRDPRRFDELYAALPAEVRAQVESLSPLNRANELGMPLELASAPQDPYFPVDEARDLAVAAPDARVTTTSVLAHAVPEPTLGDLPDLLRFDGWVMRSLRAARAG
jgi:pimeloyl-ACP methyl ester carboxylesterase